MSENTFEAFFHCKAVSKGSYFFPRKKSKLFTFWFKMHQTKTKLYNIHDLGPNTSYYSKKLLEFQGSWITSLVHSKGLFKIIFRHILL